LASVEVAGKALASIAGGFLAQAQGYTVLFLAATLVWPVCGNAVAGWVGGCFTCLVTKREKG
jgi:hypothetical protein